MVENKEIYHLKHLYEELIRSKTEFKKIIEASEARVLLGIDSLKNRLKKFNKRKY